MQKSIKLYSENVEDFSITYDDHTGQINLSIDTQEEFTKAFLNDEITKQTVINILKNFIEFAENASKSL